MDKLRPTIRRAAALATLAWRRFRRPWPRTSRLGIAARLSIAFFAVALLAVALDRPLDLADGALANVLMAGIVMDTATFAHPNATPRTLAVSAALVEAGAPLSDISRRLYRTKPDAQLRLFGRVLARLEATADRRITWSTLSLDDLASTGAIPAHFYQLLNAEMLWIRGPFSVQAEYQLMPVSTIDRGAAYFQAWYAMASLFLTGEHRAYRTKTGVLERIIPRRDFVKRDAPRSEEKAFVKEVADGLRATEDSIRGRARALARELRDAIGQGEPLTEIGDLVATPLQEARQVQFTAVS